MNEKKTPAIRFQGFTDDWEHHKLGEIFSPLNNNTLSRSELNDEQGTIQNVHYGDVLIKFGEYLNVKEQEIPFVNPSVMLSNIDFLQNGDIIFADTAEDATVGKCTEMSGIDGHKVVSGLHTMPFRPVVKFADGYLGCYLNSNAYHDQLFPLMQGIKVTSISKRALHDTLLTYPSDRKEQSQLGNYFIHLDHIITLHQRKLTKLQLLKKSMLTKMFPKDGARVPEIRFQGFHGDWKMMSVGECCREFKSGSFISANDIESSGKYPVWGGNGLRGFTTVYNHDGEFALIGRQGALCGNISYSIGKAYFTEHAIAVQTNETADTKFMYYLLDTMNLGQYSDQSAQPGLAVGKLVKLMNLFPSVEEQKCLSNYFTNLDMFIALHQHKLSKLQKIKQAMLSKLFV